MNELQKKITHMMMMRRWRRINLGENYMKELQQKNWELQQSSFKNENYTSNQ